MSQTEFLLGFFPITAAQMTGENTSWVEVMITGEKMKNGGKTFTITAEDLDTYAADIRARGGEKRIPLDYDHSYAEGGSTLASGWFTGQAEIRETEGKPTLWAEVQWTPKAADAIRAGEYAYISPEFSFQQHKDGVLSKARQLLAATLTNRPFFDRMAPVQLASRRDNGGYEPASTAPIGAGDPTMATADTTAAAIRKNLGLPDDADDSAVTAAIAAKDEEIVALKKSNDDLKASAAKSNDSMTALAAQVADLQKSQHEDKRTALLASAVEKGKILPVQLDSFVTMYDASPETVVAMLEATPEKSFKPAGVTGGSDEDVPVITLKGVKEDEVVDSADEAAEINANLAERNIDPASATIEQYLASANIVRAKKSAAA